MRTSTSGGILIRGSDTPTTTPVAASTSSTILLAANPARVHVTIMNDSTSVLYVLWGAGPASPSMYTFKMNAGAFYELPPSQVPYIGQLTGIWVSPAGTAMITEAT